MSWLKEMIEMKKEIQKELIKESEKGKKDVDFDEYKDFKKALDVFIEKMLFMLKMKGIEVLKKEEDIPTIDTYFKDLFFKKIDIYLENVSDESKKELYKLVEERIKIFIKEKDIVKAMCSYKNIDGIEKTTSVAEKDKLKTIFMEEEINIVSETKIDILKKITKEILTKSMKAIIFNEFEKHGEEELFILWIELILNLKEGKRIEKEIYKKSYIEKHISSKENIKKIRNKIIKHYEMEKDICLKKDLYGDKGYNNTLINSNVIFEYLYLLKEKEMKEISQIKLNKLRKLYMRTKYLKNKKEILKEINKIEERIEEIKKEYELAKKIKKEYNQENKTESIS